VPLKSLPEDVGILQKPVSQVIVNLNTGELIGPEVQSVTRSIRDLKGVYRDEAARQALDQEEIVYRVQSIHPVGEGVEGGLFWGSTFLEAGMVGDEYFMTKGHNHANRSRSEFYLTVAGTGVLIMMDERRRTFFEPMSAGSLHYLPSHTAHRVANVGNSRLTFLACWPSDAGHDYDVTDGFSARLRCVGGMPLLVEES